MVPVTKNPGAVRGVLTCPVIAWSPLANSDFEEQNDNRKKVWKKETKGYKPSSDLDFEKIHASKASEIELRQTGPADLINTD